MSHLENLKKKKNLKKGIISAQSHFFLFSSSSQTQVVFKLVTFLTDKQWGSKDQTVGCSQQTCSLYGEYAGELCLLLIDWSLNTKPNTPLATPLRQIYSLKKYFSSSPMRRIHYSLQHKHPAVHDALSTGKEGAGGDGEVGEHKNTAWLL